MGWARGVNAEGRDIGYAVEAACDQDGCDERIYRGLAYVCGGMHDGGEHGCGRYFCYEHLGYGNNAPDPVQLCDSCAESMETEMDDYGQWTGSCEHCGTSHDGHPPGTLGAKMACLRTQAEQLDAPHVSAQLDQLDAKLTDRRNTQLRRHFES